MVTHLNRFALEELYEDDHLAWRSMHATRRLTLSSRTHRQGAPRRATRTRHRISPRRKSAVLRGMCHRRNKHYS